MKGRGGKPHTSEEYLRDTLPKNGRYSGYFGDDPCPHSDFIEDEEGIGRQKECGCIRVREGIYYKYYDENRWHYHSRKIRQKRSKQ